MSLRRIPAISFIVAYLGATVWFAAEHVAGVSGGQRLAYFFTWDMFPFYYTESVRRVAVGETASGRRVQIVPSALEQFRNGVRGDLTRIDLERRGRYFRQTAERAVERSRVAEDRDPIVRVFLYEQYRPAKFNYPDDLYAEWWGRPKPDRSYWRLREQFPAADLGPAGGRSDL